MKLSVVSGTTFVITGPLVSDDNTRGKLKIKLFCCIPNNISQGKYTYIHIPEDNIKWNTINSALNTTSL